MKALSAAWAALTSFDQALWRTAAASISSHTRLGLPKTLTGRQFFFRHNLPPRAFDPTFLETDPPNIEQTVGPEGFIITIPVAFLWTLNYTAFPQSGITQMRLYAFRSYTSGPAIHASSWTPVLMSTPIASGTPIRPQTDAAVGPLENNDFIQFKLIFRTNGLLDSIPQFASAFG